MKLKYGIAPLALAALLTGCEQVGNMGLGRGNSTEKAEMETSTSTHTMSSSSGMSSADASRLAQLEQENAVLRASSVSSSGSVMRTSGSGNADLPPAKPGECYARILTPANYESTTERVVATEASERINIVPATYNWGEERIIVSEASSRLEVIPATYRTVKETVVVEPARKELRTIPAKYETRSEKVLISEAYTTWKKGSGPLGGSFGGGTIASTKETATGEIMCLIEVPAKYRTITKQVLVQPVRTEEINIPSVSKNVTKRVVATPAKTREVTIPAKYETVRVRKLATPAQQKRTPIPATYKTITKQKKVSQESLVWREILCETNTTPDVVRRVQAALKRAGFNPGAIDGQFGSATLRAITAYQKREGLGTGGLTMATVKKLGVM